MKNSELIKKIVKIADRLDNGNRESRQWADKGYELACILCRDYEKKVTSINALTYLKWLFYVNDFNYKL